MADGKEAPLASGDGSSAPKPDVASKVDAPKVDAKAAPKQNPVFKMMGIPNIRARLPSRNWMIFWTIIGSWSAAVYYDRREKKRIQKKWCDAVAHLAREPLPVNVMQRKVTVFLSAPPADGLLNAREHFQEYVKPILQSAGLNWDAIEGRREGGVRAAFAEWLRKRRKISGEPHTETIDEEDTEVMVEALRKARQVEEFHGSAGDIIIGRNTWKEYIRGLHEGWLGPVDTPLHVKQAMEEAEEKPADTKASETAASTTSEETASPTGDSPSPAEEGTVIHDTTTSQPEEKKEPEKPKEDDKPKKPKQPLPFIQPANYAFAPLPPSLPSELPPATAVSFPHLLGFLNTPIRIYRYLNKRKVADSIGREVAAACFAAYRPFERSSGPMGASPFAEDDAAPISSLHQEEVESTPGNKDTWEQQGMLAHEEMEWHKSVRKNLFDEREKNPEVESVWVDEMVVDPRIAGRMRRFYLDEADVERGLAEEAAHKRLVEEEEAEKAARGAPEKTDWSKSE